MKRSMGSAVAMAPLMVIALMGGHAAAAGPVPFSQLHLDQSAATFHAGAGREVSGNCLAGSPYSASTQVVLSAAADGSAVIAFNTPSIGRFSGPVMETTPGQVELNLVAKPNSNVTNTEMLSGLGTTFSGPATSTVSSPHCVADSTDSLVLGGTGLTLLARPTPSPSLAPTPTPTPSPTATATAMPAVSTAPTTTPTSSSGFPVVPVIVVVVLLAIGAGSFAMQRRRSPPAEKGPPSHNERPPRPQ